MPAMVLALSGAAPDAKRTLPLPASGPGEWSVDASIPAGAYAYSLTAGDHGELMANAERLAALAGGVFPELVQRLD